MTVDQLIAQLRLLPGNAEVRFLYDGAPYGEVECIWLSRGGGPLRVRPQAILADSCVPVYSEHDRPVDAPNDKEEPYWNTPERSHG